MAALMVQAGAGLYARLQGGVDGMITVEYGNVAGGGFYPTAPARRVHAACWDGVGWILPMVEALVKGLRPAQTRSRALEADLAQVQARMTGELRQTLRLPRKSGDEWETAARLVRALGREGRLGAAALTRFAEDQRLPRTVREAALSGDVVRRLG